MSSARPSPRWAAALQATHDSRALALDPALEAHGRGLCPRAPDGGAPSTRCRRILTA